MPDTDEINQEERLILALEDPRPLYESLPAHGLGHLVRPKEVQRPQLVLIEGGHDA